MERDGKGTRAMNIVYYTLIGNTRRFVENYLEPKLRSYGFSPQLVRLCAPGPYVKMSALTVDHVHVNPEKLSEVLEGKRNIVVFPSYGRFDPVARSVGQFTPLAVMSALEHINPEDTVFVLAGNRTFGPEFCAAKRELPDRFRDCPTVEIELSGSEADAEKVCAIL